MMGNGRGGSHRDTPNRVHRLVEAKGMEARLKVILAKQPGIAESK